MDGGLTLDFALLVVGGIAAWFILWPREPVRVQLWILGIQRRSIRERGVLHIRILGGVFMLAGAPLALIGLGAPPEAALSLVAPGLVIFGLGALMLLFPAPFARTRLRLVEWQIGWMEGPRGPAFMRVVGLLILAALLGYVAKRQA